MARRERLILVLETFVTLPEVSLDHMEQLARAIAQHLRAGDTLTLRGEVGAGKTSFARALIQAIAVDAPEVTSPTFNLMQSYDVVDEGGKPQLLWHLDLYRLESPDEALALGLDDIWEHIVLIEWPEVAEKHLPEGCLALCFDFASSPERRKLTLHGNDAWRKKIAELLSPR